MRWRGMPECELYTCGKIPTSRCTPPAFLPNRRKYLSPAGGDSSSLSRLTRQLPITRPQSSVCSTLPAHYTPTATVGNGSTEEMRNEMPHVRGVAARMRREMEKGPEIFFRGSVEPELSVPGGSDAMRFMLEANPIPNSHSHPCPHRLAAAAFSFEGITAHPSGSVQVGHAGQGFHTQLSKQLVLQHNLRKTLYIKDIDRRVTERALVGLFGKFGEVLDCRVCADGNSAMSFAFVEFRDEGSAESALARRPFRLGPKLLKVLPSKTAIVPVNADLMPKNTLEAERCSRTIYATNIDKGVSKIDVRKFFETLCGPVSRLRLLANSSHSTGIAFVEFATAESALAALSCSGLYLGSTPLRVSPSKTPVRCPDDEEFRF